MNTFQNGSQLLKDTESMSFVKNKSTIHTAKERLYMMSVAQNL